MSPQRVVRLKRAVVASLIGFVFMPMFNRWFTGFQKDRHWIGLHKFTGPASKLLGAIVFVYAVIMIIEFATKRDDEEEPEPATASGAEPGEPTSGGESAA